MELTFEQRRQRNIAELEAVKKELGLLPSTPCRPSHSGLQSRKAGLRPSSPVSMKSLDLSEPESKALVNKTDVITEGPITQKKAFKRERTAEPPLPSPFPLPYHFPSVVEAGLISQDPAVIPKYLSCVASSMLCHKLYPTREEYVQVAVEIVSKHGWMKAKLGPPTGAIVTSLQNRFKEFRRDRKAMKPDIRDGETSPKTPTTTKKTVVQKSPSIAWMQPPAIPPGEDECSFDRFSSQLREEAKRKNPRNEVTSKLMEATYAQRRKDILECSSAIPELLKKYPFLGNEDELLKDLERLAGRKNLANEIRSSWNETWAPRIMQLQYDAKKTSVRSHITADYDPENPGSLSLAAICTLCCIARDSRSKATYKNVVYFVPEISDPQEVAVELTQPQPLLVVEGTLKSPKRCFIMAEATSALQGEDGATPLIIASQMGHKEVVEILLKNTANPNLTAKNGSSPLYQASLGGHAEVVSILLSNGADPNLAMTTPPYSVPLGISAEEGHTKVVERLLNAGANINYQNQGGATPLISASLNGHMELVTLLLQRNADARIRTKNGRTAMDIAVAQGHREIVDLLKQYGSTN